MGKRAKNDPKLSISVRHALCGGHIDQLYIQDNSFQYDVDVSLYSPYYVTKDDDSLCTVVRKKK